MVEIKNTQGASSVEDQALAEGEAAGAYSSLRDCDPSRGEVDFDGLNALFAKIPSGPWDARRHSDGHEIRQIDTDPTNKHHWPFRLCRSIPGQRAGCDDAVFDFLAGVLNAWPQIAAMHSEEAEIERILAMPGEELDARLRLEGRDPDDVLAIADAALRNATMRAALETISSQYVTNRGDMAAEEALTAIKGIADRAGGQSSHRDELCQCGACTSEVVHASDCAVHAEPASPAEPCTCSAPLFFIKEEIAGILSDVVGMWPNSRMAEKYADCHKGAWEIIRRIQAASAPGMEAEGRDAAAAWGEARQPDGEAGAPDPDSATPSGDGAETSASSEAVKLLDRLEGSVRAHEALAGDPYSHRRVEQLADDIDATRTALLSRITSPSSSGRDPSGPGSQASPGTPAGCRPEGFDPSRNPRDEIDFDACGRPGRRKLATAVHYFMAQLRQSCFGEEHGTPAVLDGPTAAMPRGCWFDTESDRLLKALTPAPGGETRRAENAIAGSVHEHPIAESEAPASLSPTPPDLIQAAREAAESAALDIVDWMMTEGLAQHRTPEDDALRIGDMIFRALQTPHQGLEDGRRPEGHGLSPSVGLASDPAGSAASIPGADDVLNARLKAAGMYTIPEMMGVTPLSRWMVQVGMNDLDFFQAWLERRIREFLRMKAGYELGDKDKGDELYEWVLAHSAALSEVRDNFLAARARDQRAEREDAQRPRPEAASPVDEVEAPSSIVQGNPDPTTGGEAPGRDEANQCPACGMARDLVLANFCGHPADNACIHPDLSSKTEPCGGCGATSNDQRCMGCLHDFGDDASAWVRKHASPRSSQKEEGV